jgi:hypothetical protein
MKVNMRQRRLKLSAVLLLGLGLAGLQAQEAIPATGDNASGSGGSVSYTIGQVVYTTNTGKNGSVAEGVQQPYEISVVVGIEQAVYTNLFCKVYPNPVTEFLKLKVESYKVENFSYQLYDMNGRLLENKKITGSETSIDMSNHLPATYFLKVTEVNKEVKTFKIIKNY